MSNKYYFRAQISERKFRLILRLFCLDMEAKKVSEFTGLNRGTINHIYNKLRERIALLCEAESPFDNGEIELDESYFGFAVNEGVEHKVKFLFSGCLNEATGCIRKSLKTALQAS